MFWDHVCNHPVESLHLVVPLWVVQLQAQSSITGTFLVLLDFQSSSLGLYAGCGGLQSAYPARNKSFSYIRCFSRHQRPVTTNFVKQSVIARMYLATVFVALVTGPRYPRLLCGKEAPLFEVVFQRRSFFQPLFARRRVKHHDIRFSTSRLMDGHQIRSRIRRRVSSSTKSPSLNGEECKCSSISFRASNGTINCT